MHRRTEGEGTKTGGGTNPETTPAATDYLRRYHNFICTPNELIGIFDYSCTSEANFTRFEALSRVYADLELRNLKCKIVLDWS